MEYPAPGEMKTFLPCSREEMAAARSALYSASEMFILLLSEEKSGGAGSSPVSSTAGNMGDEPESAAGSG